MRLSSRKSSRGGSLDLQLTPMIDVVFQLLIFFLVTSSFVRPEKNLDPAIQVKNKSAAATRSDLEPAVIDIARVDGAFVYQVGSQRLATAAELADLLAKFPEKARIDGAFVRVADDVPFDMVAAAIQAAKGAGFLGVSYVPQRREGAP